MLFHVQARCFRKKHRRDEFSWYSLQTRDVKSRKTPTFGRKHARDASLDVSCLDATSSHGVMAFPLCARKCTYKERTRKRERKRQMGRERKRRKREREIERRERERVPVREDAEERYGGNG